MMNDKLGNKIAEGGCSEVYEWENKSKVIKLARANTDQAAMRREYDNNRVAWDNGLSVPQPFDFLDIEGRPGIIFERIYGETLMNRFVEKALKQESEEIDLQVFDFEDNDIRITARILSEIHNKRIINMPLQRDSIKSSIRLHDYLTSIEQESVIRLLDSLPLKKQLCHGDPNPGNILLKDGKAVVIDWMNATIGNPEADLAEYIIMMRYAILPSYLPNKVKNYFNAIREQIISTFIDEYTKYSNITGDEIDAWITPIAARKLSADTVSEDEKQLLINEIRRRLSKA